jgi:hypothetical protein
MGLAVNVCTPLHVGTIACDNAGAPSERMKFVDTPFTAVSPIVPVGLAPLVPPPATAQDPSPRKKVVASHVPVHSPVTSVLAAVVNPEPLPFTMPFSSVVTAKYRTK